MPRIASTRLLHDLALRVPRILVEGGTPALLLGLGPDLRRLIGEVEASTREDSARAGHPQTLAGKLYLATICT